MLPPAVALGSSWDPSLAERVAQAIADEAIAAGVAIVLGPGVNIKRSSLCGRNFEYLSEDPLLSGVMGASIVRGLQARGVGAGLKHFAANNQETDRLQVSADIDERPLREVYLRAFQRVVEVEQPWTVMAAYTRVNGVHASQHTQLLNEVLRGEWGFEGAVVSDWGAVVDRVAALRAGLDLEIPTTRGRTDSEIIAAVQDGSLEESTLDLAVERILSLVSKARSRPEAATVDFPAHHALAREAAARSIVLLKNDDDILPLLPVQRVAVIGAFAQDPLFQGSESSRVNPTQVDTALDGIRSRAESLTFARGFTLGTEPQINEHALLAEAVTAAETCEVAILFVSLPDAEESEGYDREHLRPPAAQLRLIDAVLDVNPRVVAVLSVGSVVELPFAERATAIVGASLLGQAGGSATADVLYGDVNPSARLAETFPLRLEHSPAYGNFPGELGHVRYGEGIFVGYRSYDLRALDVRYPFGHGLSYTRFAYGAATATEVAGGDLSVVLDVTNVGNRTGRETVQVYTGAERSVFSRPLRELAGFAQVDLDPGERRSVNIVDTGMTLKRGTPASTGGASKAANVGSTLAPRAATSVRSPLSTSPMAMK